LSLPSCPRRATSIGSTETLSAVRVGTSSEKAQPSPRPKKLPCPGPAGGKRVARGCGKSAEIDPEYSARHSRYGAQGPVLCSCSRTYPLQLAVQKCSNCEVCCEPEAPNQPCCHLALVIGRVNLATRPTIGMDLLSIHFQSFLFFCHRERELLFDASAFAPLRRYGNFSRTLLAPHIVKWLFALLTGMVKPPTSPAGVQVLAGRPMTGKSPLPACVCWCEPELLPMPPTIDCLPAACQGRGQTDEDAPERAALRIPRP